MTKKNKIKFVLGRFVYIEMPEKPETKIIVDENTKEALQKAMLKELRITTIYAVGESANKNLKVGDKVLVNPASLANPNTVMISIEEDGKEIIIALIQDFDIIHVWDED